MQKLSLPKHPAKQFLLYFSILYLLFLAIGVYGGGRTAYQGFFRAMGESVWGESGEILIARFIDPDEKSYDPEFHTMILIGNRQEAQKAAQQGKSVDVSKVYINDYMVGFLPTMTLLVLILATPMPKKRKFWAIGIGLLVVTLFVLFRQWLLVLTDMANNPSLGLMQASEAKVKF